MKSSELHPIFPSKIFSRNSDSPFLAHARLQLTISIPNHFLFLSQPSNSSFNRRQLSTSRIFTGRKLQLPLRRRWNIWNMQSEAWRAGPRQPGGDGRKKKGKYSYDFVTLINKLKKPLASWQHPEVPRFLSQQAVVKRSVQRVRSTTRLATIRPTLQIHAILPDMVKPNEHIYTIMTSLFVHEVLVEKCCEVFDEMPSQGVTRSVLSYTALINAYGRNDAYDVSLGLLHKMKKDKVSPRPLYFNL